MGESLLRELADIAPGGKHAHPEAVGALRHYVERLGAYGAGAAYYGYMFFCIATIVCLYL